MSKITLTNRVVEQPFSLSDGSQMYPVKVFFSDGRKGQAYAKSDDPPYQIGDEVEVEEKGHTKDNTPKYGVKKVRQEGGNYAPKNSGGFRGNSGSTYNQTGAKVGMALKGAIDLATNKVIPVKLIPDTAKRICEISHELEEWFEETYGNKPQESTQGPAQPDLPPNMEYVEPEDTSSDQPPPEPPPVEEIDEDDIPF